MSDTETHAFGIRFYIPDDALTELKKQIKGLFFVR
jgi:hypothetical protein